MATTNLVLASNRFLARVLLTGSSAAVPADAAISENFRLPAGFGDLALESAEASIAGFSGAYVAPAPAFDGARLGITDSVAATVQDIVGSTRFVNAGTASGRPELYTVVELFHLTIFRQAELMNVAVAILAGAGVTVSVNLRIRGVRLKNS